MPFALNRLTRLYGVPNGSGLAGRAGVTNFYGYADSDTLATIVAAGYFNLAREELRPNDVVIVSAGLGGTPATETYVFATVPATGNVTVSVEAGTP